MMVGRKSYFKKIENKRKQRFWPRKEGGLFAGQLRIIFIQPVQVPAFHLQVIFLLAFDSRSWLSVIFGIVYFLRSVPG
jgi:hypothetical protein